jgi:hypothetical protein
MLVAGCWWPVELVPVGTSEELFAVTTPEVGANRLNLSLLIPEPLPGPRDVSVTSRYEGGLVGIAWSRG